MSSLPAVMLMAQRLQVIRVIRPTARQPQDVVDVGRRLNLTDFEAVNAKRMLTEVGQPQGTPRAPISTITSLLPTDAQDGGGSLASEDGRFSWH